MKVKDLIKRLEALDPNAEILVPYSDDIMGYYSASDVDFHEEEVTQYTGKSGAIGYERSISNFIPTEPKYKNVKKTKVYIIE